MIVLFAQIPQIISTLQLLTHRFTIRSARSDEWYRYFAIYMKHIISTFNIIIQDNLIELGSMKIISTLYIYTLLLYDESSIYLTMKLIAVKCTYANICIRSGVVNIEFMKKFAFSLNMEHCRNTRSRLKNYSYKRILIFFNFVFFYIFLNVKITSCVIVAKPLQNAQALSSI